MSDVRNESKRILVVDDEETIRKLLRTRFTREGWEVEECESGPQAVEAIRAQMPDAIVTDIKMPGMDGFQFIDEARKAGCECPVVVITGHGDKECAVEAMHKGAFDYLEKPFDMNEIAFVVRRALDREALRRANARMVDELKDLNAKLEEKLEVTTTLLDHTPVKSSKVDLVGESESIHNLKNTIRTIAEAFRGNHDPVVLITGESGVGKEVVARFAHEQTFSLRGVKNAPFVAVNCAAFPEHLLESELFGYEKGAFTGANTRKLGLFELANGGTIFLDEIGEMDLRMQVKLLRVLQERVIRRLGGSSDIKITPNIIAATNRDLAAGVAAKTFREDLYYRLNTLPLVIPPLRSRPEDIVPLAEHFLKSSNLSKKFKGFSPAASKAMQNYRWPGNVRELRSVIDRAMILEKGPTLELPQLRQETLRATVGGVVGGGGGGGGGLSPEAGASVHSIRGSSESIESPASTGVSMTLTESQTFADLRKAADERFAQDVLVQYLTKEQGNVSAVARALKMDRANLLRMFRRYNIDPDLFRKKAA